MVAQYTTEGNSLLGGRPRVWARSALQNWATSRASDPGNLSRRQYADITAYIFSANEFPAGLKELDNSPSALKDIRIEEKK